MKTPFHLSERSRLFPQGDKGLGKVLTFYPEKRHNEVLFILFKLFAGDNARFAPSLKMLKSDLLSLTLFLHYVTHTEKIEMKTSI